MIACSLIAERSLFSVKRLTSLSPVMTGHHHMWSVKSIIEQIGINFWPLHAWLHVLAQRTIPIWAYYTICIILIHFRTWKQTNWCRQKYPFIHFRTISFVKPIIYLLITGTSVFTKIVSEISLPWNNQFRLRGDKAKLKEYSQIKQVWICFFLNILLEDQ